MARGPVSLSSMPKTVGPRWLDWNRPAIESFVRLGATFG
jgi:hypothetical protein